MEFNNNKPAKEKCVCEKLCHPEILDVDWEEVGKVKDGLLHIGNTIIPMNYCLKCGFKFEYEG